MALTRKALPVIPVRGFVIFPKTVFHFDVAREKSIAAVERALKSEGLLFLVSQKDEKIEEPTNKDVYTFGTVSKIRQVLRLPSGGMRLLVEGISRAKLETELICDDIYEGVVSLRNSSDNNLSAEEYSAMLNQLHLLINDFIEINPKLASEDFLKSMPEDNPSELTDVLAEHFIRKIKDKQAILEITNVKKRILKLLDILTSEVKTMDIESIIAARVKEQMDENNRDYLLREQIKAIRSELGDDSFSEIEDFRSKLEELNPPEEIYTKALRELSTLEKLPPTSPEGAVSRHYLELVCDLPWNKYTKENHDIKKARTILERDHFGMDKVKKRILEELSVISLTNSPQGSVLCLLGAPGVGKTSIAKSVAEATGREYVRISLGGMKDESELRGHRKTYVGAMPGRIVDAIRSAKSLNPLILLDEVDKLGSDYKGDPSSALLEILDSEQNFSFRDNFLEAGIDLSKVLFIATANTTETIPSPLLDRLEIIELDSYTSLEKREIASKHLIPKQISRHGLTSKQIRFSPDAINVMIQNYTREAGVRKLEREIANVCRKAASLIVENEKGKVNVNPKNLSEFLGPVRYSDDDLYPSAQIGITNGLAWTSVGGEVLVCEVSVLEGSGKIVLTGKLGDVMKESAQTALSYIRSLPCNSDKEFYKSKDIHIHFPEGAVPKDGPSAGITIATAIASAIFEVPARSDIAMTGEITLRGRVLPIGGLKEKALGAYRLGIREIIIPEKNKKDLVEIPQEVRDVITFHPVKTCDQVLTLCLAGFKPGKKDKPHSVIVPERTHSHEYS
ncbi:MAG: endopeptidase La [Clostridia bacterium]|nr:endopeptidase La [Clostridia bacterium]